MIHQDCELSGNTAENSIAKNIYRLDARRLLCPLPVIRVQEQVKRLKAGDILEVVCTDKGSLSDISAWCRVHGHHLISSHHQQREIFMTVQIGSA